MLDFGKINILLNKSYSELTQLQNELLSTSKIANFELCIVCRTCGAFSFPRFDSPLMQTFIYTLRFHNKIHISHSLHYFEYIYQENSQWHIYTSSNLSFPYVINFEIDTFSSLDPLVELVAATTALSTPVFGNFNSPFYYLLL